MGKEERPLYQGICKIEVRFIEVPLYLLIKLITFVANEDLNKGHPFCEVIRTVKLWRFCSCSKLVDRGSRSILQSYKKTLERVKCSMDI